MASEVRLPVERFAFKVPIVFLIVAAIAIPIELRPWGRGHFGLDIEAYDVIENIIGFLPIGVVFAEGGFLRALVTAALISTFAETGQLMMTHRDPSPIDIASNITGALLGIIARRTWGIRLPELRASRWLGWAALVTAAGLLAGLWVSSGAALNGRGVTAPGVLEAHWRFDESQGAGAVDSSGHGLTGKFRGRPQHAVGELGGAVKLDGKRDYIDGGRSTAFRLVGSMTISAWINSSSFPGDDAAIVSELQQDSGYQLDTTIDLGPRTIGFKLTSSCGDLMARYGRTPLAAGRWYHVAGVYNAEAQTMKVYLNGRPDDGFLLGKVTNTQYTSRLPVYVGRRGDDNEFDFAGSIDDVRIYSFALTQAEIEAAMRGEDVNGPLTVYGRAGNLRETGAACRILSDKEDGRLPVAAAAFGVLVAIAIFSFWPGAGLATFLGISFAAGFLVAPALAVTLPTLTRWVLMPLLSLAGGVSVGVSVRR